MSTTLSPAPPRPPEIGPDELEALIKEARRRARRRRALYGLSALLAVGAVVAGLEGFGGGGGRADSATPGGPDTPGAPLQSRPGPAPRPAKNGPLAIIAGAYGNRIVTVGPGGRFFRSLPICHHPRCGALTTVAWSPDGNTLAYGTSWGGEWHERDGLHVFDVARNRDRLFVDHGHNWNDLAWSPDATKLAYVEGATIFVFPIAHPDRPVLFRASSTSPSWSPDGRLIAYDRCDGDRSSGIYAARPDGSGERQLSRFGCMPSWSPNGRLIAYQTRCGIRLVTEAGEHVTSTAPWQCAHIGVAGSPTWSPDGHRIAVGGVDGVYVMNPDGSGLRKIWNHGALRPSWRALPR